MFFRVRVTAQFTLMSNDRLSNSSTSGEEYAALLTQTLAESASRQQADYSRVAYFGRYFPLKSALVMLGNNIAHRQFAFAYFVGKSLVWDAYQSFANIEELQGFLNERNPMRMDVGPLGTCPPARWKDQRKKQKAIGVEPDHATWCRKELVLDVDLKDVKLRTCACSGINANESRCATCGLEFSNYQVFNTEGYCRCRWDNFSKKLCEQCWNFAQLYVVVLDYLLRDKWGFRNLQFIFSGGKGFHCWILDERAQYFSPDDREAFLEAFKPWESDGKLKDEEHYEDQLFGKDFDSFIVPLFTEKILNTGIFNIQHLATKRLILTLFVIDESNEEAVKLFMGTVDACLKLTDAVAVWNRLMDYNFRVNTAFNAKIIQRKFIYSYIFPPLDERITTDPRHLLKIPFSLHPSTGFLSVPLSAREFYNFSPESGPHVEQPSDISRCGDNFLAIASVRAIKLDRFFFCKEDTITTLNFPEFVNLKIREIIEQFGCVLRQKLRRRQIFATEREYQRHSLHCLDCDSYLLVGRENNLESWLQRLAWIENSYYDHVELGMRIALLNYLEKLHLIAPPPEKQRLEALF